ncbi:MAG: disulfide bond formation protein B [Aquabacterium sp.]
MPAPRLTLGLAGVLALAAVAAALVSQHVYDMQPCPWCILQRLLFVLIGVVGLLVAARPGWTTAGAFAIDGLASAGIAAALWQNQVASRSVSCNLTLADRIVSGSGLDRLLPDVFAVRSNCADAQVALLGLPYEIWSLVLFALLAMLATRVMLGWLRSLSRS